MASKGRLLVFCGLVAAPIALARRMPRPCEVVGWCAILFSTIVAWAPRAEAATPAPLVICMGQAVPAGQVITAISHTAKCGSALGPNTMTLTNYAGLATFNACMPVSPIPSGYAVTAQIHTAVCGGAPGVNAVTLKKL